MDYTELSYEVDGHVGLITIQRPEARNALSWTTYAELEDAVRTTTERCLIITGADPAFCSGDDVKQILSNASDRVASDLSR
ncbi:MAG: enoyl-CoA hydratase-related protein, partial [Actinomycetota bacterium]